MAHIRGQICEKHPELNGLRIKRPNRIGSCVQCNKDAQRRYYEANKERLRDRHRQYARANKHKNEARALAWAKANRARHNANARAWNAANKERSYGFTARWAKSNPDKAAAMAANYRATKAAATPQWADRKAILALYAEARRLTEETGVKHHVDHIVPLNHSMVSGLHVEANLQVLPASENARKGNRRWPDMPEALRA